MSIQYLKGAIGVSFFMFKKNNENKKLFILSDMHDKLPNCKTNNYIKINEWLYKKLKLNKYQILLEEIPRNKKLKLMELWSRSEHTIDLKNFYLKYHREIEGIDIRVFLIPFSADILDDNLLINKNKKDYDITLDEYLFDLSKFINDPESFKLKNLNFFKKPHIDTEVIEHFNSIKNNFESIIEKYKDFFKQSVIDLYNNENYLFTEIENILNDCMEWYCCFLINYYHKINKNIILHAGLYHTNNINYYLKKKYNYELIYKEGMTSLDNKTSYDCLNLPKINDYI